MSVIIRGMEMPQSCRCCPMCSVAEWWCDATNKNLVHAISEETGKAEWCPLVEVPTPHGRLIDADELIEEKDWIYFGGGNNAYIKFSDVNYASTVIEAEE